MRLLLIIIAFKIKHWKCSKMIYDVSNFEHPSQIDCPQCMQFKEEGRLTHCKWRSQNGPDNGEIMNWWVTMALFWLLTCILYLAYWKDDTQRHINICNARPHLRAGVAPEGQESTWYWLLRRFQWVKFCNCQIIFVCRLAKYLCTLFVTCSICHKLDGHSGCNWKRRAVQNTDIAPDRWCQRSLPW